jgi:DNA-binding NarL/FixJ family response regulator
MNITPSKISIAVVDDHKLFRAGLIDLIKRLDPNFEIVAEADHGITLLNLIETGIIPDVIIIDLNMPVMDGLTTISKLRISYPQLKTLVLTMKDDEYTLIQLLKAGANGFLSKDIEPQELKRAILSIHQDTYYHSEYIAGKLVGALTSPANKSAQIKLNDQELRFIVLACTEYTYKEIANIMCLSVKTIDGYRGRLFEKLNVKSRVGLVLYALRKKLISLN